MTLKNSDIESDDRDIDAQAAAWLIRLRAENVTSEERALFLRWLNLNEAHQQAFDEIGKLWGDEDLLQALVDSAQKNRIAPRPKTRGIQFKLALAACLVLALLFKGEFEILMQSDYSTGLGERKTVYLNDGSSAMLNTDSSIAVNLEGAERKIRLLKGEVYFDVKPDAERPFIVQADHSITRVLGTRFFVHEKKGSDEIKVISGRVEVTGRDALKQSVILHDQEAVSLDASALGETHPLDSVLTTSWVNGFLVFQDVPLESVINQVFRYRRGFVVYRDDALRSLMINGRVNLREPDEMLEALEKNLSIKITHLTGWLVIIG